MTLTDIKKFRISLKGYEVKLLDRSCKQIIEALKQTATQISGPIFLPTKRRIYCLLCSPHVNKDSREHFEIKTHKRILDIYSPTIKTIQSLKALDISAGVEVEILYFN